MSNFVQFEATSPIVKPATEEVVYDKYWVSNFKIMAEDSTRPVRLVVSFVPARDVTVSNGEEGTVTYKEIQKSASPKRLVINDLFEEAEKDAEGLGMLLNNVLTYVKNRAIAENIL